MYHKRPLLFFSVFRLKGGLIILNKVIFELSFYKSKLKRVEVQKFKEIIFLQ